MRTLYRSIRALMLPLTLERRRQRLDLYIDRLNWEDVINY